MFTGVHWAFLFFFGHGGVPNWRSDETKSKEVTYNGETTQQLRWNNNK